MVGNLAFDIGTVCPLEQTKLDRALIANTRWGKIGETVPPPHTHTLRVKKQRKWEKFECRQQRQVFKYVK
jgi:hypothetical protein